MKYKLSFLLLMSGLAVIFIAQNSAMVEIKFFTWQAAIPNSILIFFSLLGGFILGWILQSYLSYRKSRDVYEYLS